MLNLSTSLQGERPKSAIRSAKPPAIAPDRPRLTVISDGTFVVAGAHDEVSRTFAIHQLAATDMQSMLAAANLGVVAVFATDGSAAIDICRRLLGAEVEAPIAVFAQEMDDFREVALLSMGVDDVALATARPEVICARLLRTQRRAQRAPRRDLPSCLQFGRLELNRSLGVATFEGKELSLTNSEFEILWLLASKCGTVVSRDELCQMVGHPADEKGKRVINSRIHRIRKKLEGATGVRNRLRSTRSVGYVFLAGGW